MQELQPGFQPNEEEGVSKLRKYAMVDWPIKDGTRIMPLQPNGGKLLMPVETEANVSALFEKALELSQTSGFLC